MRASVHVTIVVAVLCFFSLSVVGQDKGSKRDKIMLKFTFVIDKKTVERGEQVNNSFEIHNVSDKPIEIRWTRHEIFEFLTWETQYPDGKIERRNYVEALSPFTPIPISYTLNPGDKKSWKFKGFGSMTREWPLGLYRFKVIFEYKGITAVSPPVEMELVEPKKSP